ncbi:MAG: copper chaperone PCu(A)C [Burkholderiales bacterium]|nr:copper chaperone PCu(A)C [Burkholderiales bacterium]
MKILVTLALFASLAAHAHDFSLKDLRIVHPVANATVPGATTGGAYLTLENKGRTADRLVAASTPRAKRVELHTMSMDGGVMRMREVDGIEIKPGETIKMRPGSGFHLMLMELPAPLKDGETFPLTLTFEKSGKVEVKTWVQKAKGGHEHHKH